MKNFKVTAIVVLGLLSLASARLSSAQISPNAIGARLGGGFGGGGTEVTYQRGLGLANRMELDFGWYTDRSDYPYGDWSQLGLAAIYQWDWNITQGLNWYIGPGAAVSLYSGSHDNHNDSDIGMSVGGQLGLEYNFNEMGAPILVSLDVRPMWGFLTNGGGGGDGAFSVRYTF